MSTTSDPTRTVVLVHGNFVTRHCWDRWVARYEHRGYTVVPIAYPGRNRPVAELRKNPQEPFLGRLTLKETLAHHVRAIRTLSEPPVLIGHSFGGLLTQLLLQRDLGLAGVAISSVPPPGVLPTSWSFVRSTWPVLNPLVPASRPYYMPFRHFQYAFANDLSEDEQRAGYDADVVPESRRLARGGLSPTARVDFGRRRPPLLLIGAEMDHIMPASLNRRNHRRYRKSPSVTEYREFPGRGHYSILAGRGWEEVADTALSWALDAASKHTAPARLRPSA